jgi:hypothetical protein
VDIIHLDVKRVIYIQEKESEASKPCCNLEPKLKLSADREYVNDPSNGKQPHTLCLFINNCSNKSIILKASSSISLIHPSEPAKSIVRYLSSDTEVRPGGRSCWPNFCRFSALFPFTDLATVFVKEGAFYDV